MDSICWIQGIYSFCVSYICKQNALKGHRFNFIGMRNR